MTKAEICQAFREAMSEEFINIPSENEIIYEFSDRFKTRMEKLFEKVEKNKTYTSSRKGKTAVIIIASILITFALMMSVSAVREPIVNIVLEFYDKYIDLSFKGDLSVSDDKVYSFTKLPDGFEETERIKYGEYKEVDYLNKITGEQISLSQSPTDGISASIDNEHGNIICKEINGYQVYIYIYEEGDIFVANWVAGTSCLCLTYWGNIDVDDFTELIKTVE